MTLARDELVKRIAMEISLRQLDQAKSDVQSVCDLGYPPPTDSVNTELTQIGSTYRLKELGPPRQTCVNHPHGGGCDLAYPLRIINLKDSNFKDDFEAVVKVRWDNPLGYFKQVGLAAQNSLRSAYGVVSQHASRASEAVRSFLAKTR